MGKKDIEISQGKYIVVPAELCNCNGNLLIVGKFKGFFGDIVNKKLEASPLFWTTNLTLLLNALKNKNSNIFIVGNQSMIDYFTSIIKYIIRMNIITKKVAKKTVKFTVVSEENEEAPYETYLSEKLINYFKRTNMKFDTIIQNPPYKGTLHFDFLEKGLELLSENGKMVIIEPATWVINIRKKGDAKSKYNPMKDKLKGHIKSIKIENFNKEFGITNQVPFSITTIDMNNYYPTIEFTCLGVTKNVDSVYDCNLIGSYNTIWSILNKVQKYGDMMKKHITKKDMSNGYWYGKYQEIGRCGCSSGDRAHLDSYYYDEVFKYFYFNGLDNRDDISNKIIKTKDDGGHYTEKDANCVYGTYDEIINWKHFIYNNKLSLFINYCLSIDQHNNSKDFLPWLVDKQYTDDEINKMFGFTNEEIELINNTIKKYERNSPWFKRYMCGPDSVSDDEVNNFIKNL